MIIAVFQVYGGAQLGDRTMLDALLPSLAALRSTMADADKTDLEAFEAATCAAEKGLLTTLPLPLPKMKFQSLKIKRTADNFVSI